MPTLPLNTHGLRWFDDSPSAGDAACTCSHCGRIIADEVPIRLWNASGQEARLHQRCFAARTHSPPDVEAVPLTEEDDLLDLLQEEAPPITVGRCCACRRVDVECRNLVMLHVQAPVPGTGWGCVVCGLPNDGALALVCDGCLERNAPILDAIEGYASKGGRIARDTLTVPFEHKAIPH